VDKRISNQKNISAKSVYVGIMSRNAYERFEKGEGDTSTSHFFAILSRLNIDYTDMVSMPMSSALGSSYIVKKMHRIFREESFSNEGTIWEMGNKYLLLFFQVGSSRSDTVNISLYAKCISSILRNQVSAALLYSCPLKNFLSKIETWSNTEIIIFSDLAICYSTDALWGITNMCVNSYRKHHQASLVYVSELLSSVISVCIFRKKRTLAQLLLKLFEELLHEDEQVEGLFAIKYTILMNIVHSEKNNDYSCLIPVESMRQLHLENAIVRYERVVPEVLLNLKFHYL